MMMMMVQLPRKLVVTTSEDRPGFQSEAETVKNLGVLRDSDGDA
jgi:hypothetical protein